MDTEHKKYSECHNCKESDRKYIGHTDQQCPVVRRAKQSRAHIAEEQTSSESMSEDSVKGLLFSLDAKKLKSAFKAYAKDKKAKNKSAKKAAAKKAAKAAKKAKAHKAAKRKAKAKAADISSTSDEDGWMGNIYD